MLSTPPAATSSASPVLMRRAACAAASRPLAQSRFTVTPGTRSGSPASSTAMRATLRLSSPVCLRQLRHYEEQREKLVATGATLWAVSTDKLEKHERMAKSYALSFPLLADPEGKVADSYGVRSLLGTARRSVFLIDPQGIVRYRHEDPLSLSYRSVDDILRALDESGLVKTTA